VPALRYSPCLSLNARASCPPTRRRVAVDARDGVASPIWSLTISPRAETEKSEKKAAAPAKKRSSPYNQVRLSPSIVSSLLLLLTSANSISRRHWRNSRAKCPRSRLVAAFFASGALFLIYYILNSTVGVAYCFAHGNIADVFARIFTEERFKLAAERWKKYADSSVHRVVFTC
jgi:hypothetical protein